MGLALLSATGVISTKKKATSLEGLSRCQGLILRPHRESNPLRHNVLCMWRGRVNSDTFIKCSLLWRENFVSFNLEIFHDCGGRKCWTLRLTFGWFSSLDEEGRTLDMDISHAGGTQFMWSPNIIQSDRLPFALSLLGDYLSSGSQCNNLDTDTSPLFPSRDPHTPNIKTGRKKKDRIQKQ